MWIKLKLTAVVITLLLTTSPSISTASIENAELYEICGREYNNCQVQCDQKNNRIAECGNKCYTEYIKCRGGK